MNQAQFLALLNQFQPRDEQENAAKNHVVELVEKYGASALTAEPMDGPHFVHIVAAARVETPEEMHFLRVWGAKEGAWKWPGAHGEGDFELEAIAAREAKRALGVDNSFDLAQGVICEISSHEVPQYWNTPTHLHLEIVWQFVAPQLETLPKGARWFAAEAVPK